MSIVKLLEQRRVARIHADFDSAQERLLEDAKNILASLPTIKVKNEELAERLKKLGFTAAAQVAEVEQIKQKQEELKHKKIRTEEEARTIMHYKTTYPFLKFLTVEELDKLCEKWSLVHAEAQYYKEAIPLKNLEDIERAQPLKLEDAVDEQFEIRPLWSGDRDAVNRLLRFAGLSNIVSKTDATRACLKFYGYVPDGWDNVRESNMWLAAVKIWLESQPNANRSQIDSLYSSTIRAIPTNESSKTLYIAAPKSHFNLEGLTQTSKHGFRFIPEPKDPIVFRYVVGGIQVLTKWGLEASDPMLINEINN